MCAKVLTMPVVRSLGCGIVGNRYWTPTTEGRQCFPWTAMRERHATVTDVKHPISAPADRRGSRGTAPAYSH